MLDLPAIHSALSILSSSLLAWVYLVPGLIIGLFFGAMPGISITMAMAIFAAAALLAIAGGVIVATSLGARTHVANLIGAHQSRQSFAVGQSIRVAGHEGRILEMTADSIVLETNDGRLRIPGRVFSEEAVLLVARGGGDD